MSDIRVSMREFRFLEEKRKLAPLTPVEEQRWIELGRTLGIFELAEANPDDVVEVDPSDVVLVEPGPDEGNGPLLTSPGQDEAAVPLTQNFEWVPPYQAPEESISLEPDAPQAQATAATAPFAANAGEVQGEIEPPLAENAEAMSAAADSQPSALPERAADRGEPWDGVPPVPAEEPPSDPAPTSDSPVIDLSAADAADSEASTRASATPDSGNGVPPSGPNEAPTNDMPEVWMGEAAAQVFPKTSPQFRRSLEPPSTSMLEGERRVVIHLLDGQVRRGTVRDLDLMASNVPLDSGGTVENIAVDRLKAIFFMLAPGSAKPPPLGQKIRLTFQDGREVIGFSTDFRTGDPGFFLIPADLKTNTERIFVFRWSVYSIAEE